MWVQLLFGLLSCLAFVAAGEEPMSPSEVDPHHHHVTTVCIQVHGSPAALCGPQVPMKPEAARGANLKMAPGGEPSRANQYQLRDAITGGPPSDAVLQGYYDNVPVYRMRSSEEIQQAKAAPPCPEPNSRSVVSVVQPPAYSGLHSPLIGSGLGLGGISPLGTPGSVVTVQQPQMGYYRSNQGPQPGPSPSVRTIPFAPFGVEPQLQQQAQQMRASQFAAARSQQYATMRAAANAADCDDGPKFEAASRGSNFQPASSFQGQQQMRQAYMAPPSQSFASMRESQQSADYLAKQCAEQEQEIKKKSEEITELKKQLDRLSSMAEKTIEQKTVSIKSASAESTSDSQKSTTEDAKKDLQNGKKKK